MSLQIDQLIEKTTRDLFKICFNEDSATRLFYKQNKHLLTISKFHLFTNRACSKNHVSIIKYIFEHKKFELVNINYLKMLEISRRHNHQEILCLLEEKSKQLDIFSIIRRDDLHNLVFLKENNIEVSQEQFIQCIVYGSVNILRYLIEMNYYIDKECFKACIAFNQNESFELLINVGKHDPEIYIESVDLAIEAGNIYVLKYCLDHIDSKSELSASDNSDYISTLVAITIEEEQTDMLEYLLEKYSSLDIKLPPVIFCHLIADAKIDILNILSDYKIKATYNQIHYSISLDNLEVTIILLDAYKPSIPDLLKYSCVAHACRTDNIEIIDYILEEDPLSYICYDEFLEIAYTYENYDIAYYLIEEHFHRLQSVDQEVLNTIRSIVLKFKPQLSFTDKVPDHTECGICTLELKTGENILSCTVCKNLTHSECYSKWGKSCVYCRN